MPRTLLCASVCASVALAGCCDQAEDCPRNAVAIFVTEDGASVAGVTVEGDAAFVCAEDEGATVCTPETTIADGDYALIVSIEGREPVELELAVRTNTAPPFSCECEIPEGSETIELAPLEEADLDAGL